MAFVAGFEFDVFISYCQIDNLPIDGIRWVEKFHERLEIHLWQKEGRRQIQIWRDRELDGAQSFDRTIQSKLEKTAVLLCLHSPAYSASAYCAKELDWFRTAHANHLEIGDRSRIVSAMLFNMPRADWPEAFHGRTGFPFYHADSPQSLGYPLPVKSDEFTRQLHLLSDALFATLRAMRQQEAPSPGPAATPAIRVPPTASHGRLFFAKVSDTLSSRKKRVIADLTDEGFEVLDPVPPPFENPAHDELVAKRIQEADLSIHLLDQFPGEPLPGDHVGYIQRQAEVGRQSKTAQLIWVPKDLELHHVEPDSIEEKKHLDFLGQLETPPRAGADYDFIRGARSDITQEIRDRLQRRKAPPAPAPQTSVLLDVHYKDQPYVADLYRYLSDKGIQPLLNPEVDDPRASESLFVEQLKRVNGLIVFFGQVAPEWVVERLFTAAKIKTLTRSPVKAFGIFMVPPGAPEGGLPNDWSPWRVHAMDNRQGFDPGSLTPLLTDLGPATVDISHV